ncbi:hypothetical protein N7537_005114 [Penicillium hordei]|uniref:Uncharacterized protein n=1 Tax=Penicillium hordei TaxID=40994 RepID=A0AAD6ECJ3_9EURO|nr:uncharacterized protein N7537_005114 [Penicillium hordei]KAJ5608495.1 hypothetical protein N7537_005114 [Penicillium hordei]
MLFRDLSPPLDRVGKKVVALDASIVLGAPLSFYLWQRGGTKNSSNNAVGKHRGANQEYTQNAEGNQGDEPTVKGQDSDPNNSVHDEPRAMGSAKGPTSMSFKQQGLSNADTVNPYANEPGKSEKGEGETETAKVKGTVKPERPQI